MLERFTAAAHQAVETAVNSTDGALVDTESLVLGLSSVGGLAEHALRSCRIDTAAMQAALAYRIERLPASTGGARPEFSAKVRAILERAVHEADAIGHTEVGTGHVLLALLRLADSSDGRLLRSILKHEVQVRRFVLTALFERGARRTEDAPEEPPVRLSSLVAELPEGARERSRLAELGLTPAIVLQMEEAAPAPLLASRRQLAELASRRTGTTAGEVDLLIEALAHEPAARAIVSKTGLNPDLVVADLVLHPGASLPTMSKAWSGGAVLARFMGPVLQLIAAGLVVRGAIGGPWWIWLLVPLCGVGYPSVPVWVALAVAVGVAIVEPAAGIALLGAALAGAATSVLDRVVLLSTTGSEVPRRDRVYLEVIAGRSARMARTGRLYRRLGPTHAQSLLAGDEPWNPPGPVARTVVRPSSEGAVGYLQNPPEAAGSRDPMDAETLLPPAAPTFDTGQSPRALRVLSSLTLVLMMALIVWSAVNRDWLSLLGFGLLLLLQLYGRVIYIVMAGVLAWFAGLQLVAAIAAALVPLWLMLQLAAASRSARAVREDVILERLERVEGADSIIDESQARPFTTMHLDWPMEAGAPVGFDGPLLREGSLSWCAAEALILGDLARRRLSPDLSLLEAAARFAPLLPLCALHRAGVDASETDIWDVETLLDLARGEPALDDVGRRAVVMANRAAPESDATAESLWHTPTRSTLVKLLSPRSAPWVSS